MALNFTIRRKIFQNSYKVIVVPASNYNTKDLHEINDPNLENVKRGTGYRSSFTGTVCTVFGATGLIGCHVVNRLAKYGTQVVVPHRSDWYKAMFARVAGDLGQIHFSPFFLDDEDSIRRAIQYSDVVINLVGRDHDTMNYSLEKVHIDGARRIARLCREKGIKKLIHVSALNASPNPKPIVIKGGSRFYKSKWYGELAVKEEFPEAIIVRPSDIFGECDRFFGYYGRSQRLPLRKCFLYANGCETIKRPVFAWDVSGGIHELVKRHYKDVNGKTYQFVGPRSYVLRNLVEYILKNMWKEEEEYGLKFEDSRFSLLWKIYMEWRDRFYFTENRSLLTWERFEREHYTDEVDENGLTLKDLGVQLTNIEDVCQTYCYQWKAQGDYIEEVYEIPPVPGPPIFKQY